MKKAEMENKTELLNERGTTMLEYMFMLMLILLVCLLGVTNIGTVTDNSFKDSAMTDAFNGGG